jgi:hypothetical protein
MIMVQFLAWFSLFKANDVLHYVQRNFANTARVFVAPLVLATTQKKVI